MAGDAPELVRCTLVISHLASMEARRVGPALEIVLDLDPSLSKWDASERFGHVEPPAGTAVRPRVVVPESNRLILDATVPPGLASGTEAARLLAWVAERLGELHKG